MHRLSNTAISPLAAWAIFAFSQRDVYRATRRAPIRQVKLRTSTRRAQIRQVKLEISSRCTSRQPTPRFAPTTADHGTCGARHQSKKRHCTAEGSCLRHSKSSRLASFFRLSCSLLYTIHQHTTPTSSIQHSASPPTIHTRYHPQPTSHATGLDSSFTGRVHHEARGSLPRCACHWIECWPDAFQLLLRYRLLARRTQC